MAVSLLCPFLALHLEGVHSFDLQMPLDGPVEFKDHADTIHLLGHRIFTT